MQYTWKHSLDFFSLSVIHSPSCSIDLSFHLNLNQSANGGQAAHQIECQARICRFDWIFKNAVLEGHQNDKHETNAKEELVGAPMNLKSQILTWFKGWINKG